MVWRTVVEEAGGLRVGEVGARDLSSKALGLWDRGHRLCDCRKARRPARRGLSMDVPHWRTDQVQGVSCATLDKGQEI